MGAGHVWCAGQIMSGYNLDAICILMQGVKEGWGEDDLIRDSECKPNFCLLENSTGFL